jgi:hypothetical protein
MTLEVWFWVFYVLALVLGLYAGYSYRGQPYAYTAWGGNLFFFVLIGILGWKLFGSPVK